jgi:hypothetical protein
VNQLERFPGILFPTPLGKEEGQESFPNPPHLTSPDFKLLLRWLGAIGRATPLALARVLAFAAVVVGFAAALALAGILAFTSVLFLDLLVVFSCLGPGPDPAR